MEPRSPKLHHQLPITPPLHVRRRNNQASHPRSNNRLQPLDQNRKRYGTTHSLAQQKHHSIPHHTPMVSRRPRMDRHSTRPPRMQGRRQHKRTSPPTHPTHHHHVDPRSKTPQKTHPNTNLTSIKKAQPIRLRFLIIRHSKPRRNPLPRNIHLLLQAMPVCIRNPFILL